MEITFGRLIGIFGGVLVLIYSGLYAFNTYQAGTYPAEKIGSLPKCVLDRAQKRLEKGSVLTRHEVSIDRGICEDEEESRVMRAKHDNDMGEQIKAVSKAKE